jgi:hypothetical protein
MSQYADGEQLGALPYSTAGWYPGGSGSAGSETSAEREHREDTGGITGQRQAEVYNFIRACGPKGATVGDVEDVFHVHHGVASGALTRLHRAGKLERLAEARNGMHIYVTPGYAQGRARSRYVPNRQNRKASDVSDEELAQMMVDLDIPHEFFQRLREILRRVS